MKALITILIAVGLEAAVFQKEKPKQIVGFGYSTPGIYSGDRSCMGDLIPDKNGKLKPKREACKAFLCDWDSPDLKKCLSK